MMLYESNRNLTTSIKAPLECKTQSTSLFTGSAAASAVVNAFQTESAF